MSSPTKYTHLLVENDVISRVTLNRPDVRNAFNEELLQELTDVFESLNKSEICRVIVLQAKGKSFCAGADLNWMRSMVSYTYEENVKDSSRLANMLNTIYRCSKPVIAKIEGDVYAGGVGLAAVCDILVASSNVRFCISEAKLGLLPATISPYVIKALGEQACKRYFLTAEVFSSQKAYELGFVHEISPPELVEAKILELCTAILNNAPQATAKCKQLIQDIAPLELTEGLINESIIRIAEIRTSAEAQTRMKSFLEKK
jgi:methylglutaconyl-CoA hydratase